MRYRYYYKKYKHSKLATALSSLQGSFWGVIAIAIIPAIPFLIISVTMDVPALLSIVGLILVGGSILIFKIDTDKIEERKILEIKKQNQSLSSQKDLNEQKEVLMLARNFLVQICMEKAIFMAEKMDDEEEKKKFIAKFPIVEEAIESFILEQEKIHGHLFLMEKSPQTDEIHTNIDHITFAITCYYAFNFDELLNCYPMNEVVNAIAYISKHHSEVENFDFMEMLIDRLSTVEIIKDYEK